MTTPTRSGGNTNDGRAADGLGEFFSSFSQQYHDDGSVPASPTDAAAMPPPPPPAPRYAPVAVTYKPTRPVAALERTKQIV